MRHFLRALAALPVLLLFASCCTYREDVPTVITVAGKPACAAHRVPLITVAGFEYEPGKYLVHPSIERERFDCRYPNAMPLSASLVKERLKNSPTKVTYCPKCEAALKKHFAAYNAKLAREQ